MCVCHFLFWDSKRVMIELAIYSSYTEKTLKMNAPRSSSDALYIVDRASELINKN